MLELYHNVNSVCAQKVRIALVEKGLEAKEHLLTLQGDQFSPDYMKLNPEAVVPTLVHDGVPIVESSVILYYLDDAFPTPPMMPSDPLSRARARQFNKLIDEYVHNSCTVITFATAYHPMLARQSKEELEASLAKSPSKKRSDFKRDLHTHGLDSPYVRDAVQAHDKLLGWIEESMRRGKYLAGDAFSMADVGVVPYVFRLELVKLTRLWDKRPGVAAWYERVKSRPSFQQQVIARMTPQHWALFKNYDGDPWPKVSALLRVA